MKSHFGRAFLRKRQFNSLMDKAKAMWFVYLVKCQDDSFYCGLTNDVDRRLKMHNSGQGAKYTKIRRPVTLIYSEQFETRLEAMRREIKIKTFTREAKEKLIAGAV